MKIEVEVGMSVFLCIYSLELEFFIGEVEEEADMSCMIFLFSMA